jgi:hypothetical protein
VTKAGLNIGSPVTETRSPDAERTAELRRNSASLSGFASSQTHYTSLSAREAVLFRNFVDNMALWVSAPSDVPVPFFLNLPCILMGNANILIDRHYRPSKTL